MDKDSHSECVFGNNRKYLIFSSRLFSPKLTSDTSRTEGYRNNVHRAYHT